MASLSSTVFTTAMLPRKAAVATSTNLQPIPNLNLLSLKSAPSRLTCMATYNVKLLTPEGEVTFECDEDVAILDQADEVGQDLPYSCRNGSCSTCAGKVVSGTVNQDDNTFLDDDQIAAGWVLTCIAKPTADVVIETHKEEELTGY